MHVLRNFRVFLGPGLKSGALLYATTSHSTELRRTIIEYDVSLTKFASLVVSGMRAADRRWRMAAILKINKCKCKLICQQNIFANIDALIRFVC